MLPPCAQWPASYTALSALQLAPVLCNTFMFWLLSKLHSLLTDQPEQQPEQASATRCLQALVTDTIPLLLCRRQAGQAVTASWLPAFCTTPMGMQCALATCSSRARRRTARPRSSCAATWSP